MYAFPVARKSTPCLNPKFKTKSAVLTIIFNCGILWVFPFPFPLACAYPAKLRMTPSGYRKMRVCSHEDKYSANHPIFVLLYTPK